MKLLGANWRTSVSGIIMLIAGAIAFKPDLVNFIPEPIRGYVVGVSAFLVFVSGGAFVFSAKDKQVTGGVVQQTAGGAVADAGTQSMVDQTVLASIQSGEAVTPEQRAGALS